MRSDYLNEGIVWCTYPGGREIILPIHRYCRVAVSGRNFAML